jgi:protein arginine kinase activator
MRCFFCDNEAIAKVYTSIDGCQQQIDVCEMHLSEIKNFNFEQLCKDMLGMLRGSPLFGTIFSQSKMRSNNVKFNWEHIAKCPECFEVFQKAVIPMMENIHTKYHVRTNSAPVYRLRRDLEVALKEERFEDAAKIRDEIKKLEESNGKKQS